MKIRAPLISASILSAVSPHADESDDAGPASGPRKSRNVIRVVLTFFSFFKLRLARYRRAAFHGLREDVWRLDEAQYAESFRQAARGTHGDGGDHQLKPIGDLGYSGSTFFSTADGRYLIKSLPRRFEHEFFTHELFDPYVAHMRAHPHSLLVRITDMVYTPLPTLGGILGTAPTHHIIMENLLYGKDADPRGSDWETYDLKPNDYFFPERDIAGGRLAPESVKARLIDEFPDTVKVTPEAKKQLLALLEADTQLLAERNAVDYSLFLVRYPCPRGQAQERRVLNVQSDADPWRTGLDDAEGKWTYRVVVLDFFWARHNFQAHLFSGLVKAYNMIAHHGPMTITANPSEYRTRFLEMVREIVIAQ